MPPLPTPDPAAGEAAAKAAEETRDTAEASLKDGSLSLTDLFAQVDGEQGKHVLGHMHAKAALVALSNVSDAEADKILADLGIKHNEHLDVLGQKQRDALVAAATAST